MLAVDTTEAKWTCDVVRPKITKLQQAAPLLVISQRTTMRIWSDHDEVDGDGRSRTDIFLVASEALGQLSYIPDADGWSRTTSARGDRVTAC